MFESKADWLQYAKSYEADSLLRHFVPDWPNICKPYDNQELMQMAESEYIRACIVSGAQLCVDKDCWKKADMIKHGEYILRRLLQDDDFPMVHKKSYELLYPFFEREKNQTIHNGWIIHENDGTYEIALYFCHISHLIYFSSVETQVIGSIENKKYVLAKLKQVIKQFQSESAFKELSEHHDAKIEIGLCTNAFLAHIISRVVWISQLILSKENWSKGADQNSGNAQTIIDSLKTYLPPHGLITLKISKSTQGSEEKKREVFEFVAQDVCYSLSNYMQKSIVLCREITELFRKSSEMIQYAIYHQQKSTYMPLFGSHKSKWNHRQQKELLEYYQRGLSTNDLAASYMSFYNILEYGMNQTKIEELCKAFQNSVQPELNEEQLLSINDFIINGKNKDLLGELYRGKEETALKKIVGMLDPGKIRERVEYWLRKGTTEKVRSNLFEEFVHYISNANHPFIESSKECFINWEKSDFGKKFLTKVALRIYTVRCALTHSKDDNSSIRYSPTSPLHEKYLIFELVLLRAVVNCYLEET